MPLRWKKLHQFHRRSWYGIQPGHVHSAHADVHTTTPHNPTTSLINAMSVWHPVLACPVRPPARPPAPGFSKGVNVGVDGQTKASQAAAAEPRLARSDRGPRHARSRPLVRWFNVHFSSSTDEKPGRRTPPSALRSTHARLSVSLYHQRRLRYCFVLT